jgi:Trk-type K+ transport system membrane component
MAEKKSSLRHVALLAVLLSGAITLIISVITAVAEYFLRDLSFSVSGPSLLPREATIRMGCFIAFVFFSCVYLPLRLRVQEKTISKKRFIILVTILTYLLSSVSLAVFLSITTEMIDYDSLAEENIYTRKLLDEIDRRNEEGLYSFDITLNFKESFFDAVSAFTTTGLTAFEETDIGVSKIDAQPPLIHIIRATYLWIGGLGIMFFYLYFTPVPSLMMSMGYEIVTERSLPRFIRLEGLSFSMVYVVITALGVFLLFLSISNALSNNPGEKEIDNKTKLMYSVVLSFSSISTGGFSPSSDPVNELKVEKSIERDTNIALKKYLLGDDLKEMEGFLPSKETAVKTYRIINNWGLLIIMVLMLAGAMPIFSLHRPLKFIRRWKLFAVFFLPIIGYAVLSYSQGPQVSFYRSFDAISAFTTTGLYTSQFNDDLRMPSSSVYLVRYDENRIKEIYSYRLRSISLIVLMFIGGAAYSTAGGWGFFNFFFALSVIYLILTGKLERALSKYILKLIMSFLLFLLIFVVLTIGCYLSGLFGTFSGPEPAAVGDYLMNSAFYEISALSTVGLMPEIVQNGSIYQNNGAYAILVISMLVGRLYYIIFPFIVSPSDEEET